ncbi:MAG: MotA/TolQ/ExbB proton channel family protein [Planctomycetaceae bacterium]|nr:MotA/TolQ/ExbB proton channel family protein [Planctomycetaceae bacterium]
MTRPNHDPYPLSWYRNDLEQRFGFRGGRFTNVNAKLMFLLALVGTTLFYITLFFLPDSFFKAMCTERGVIPYPTVFFGFWTLAILAVKWSKLREQRKALAFPVLPDTIGFVISPNTVDLVLEIIRKTASDPNAYLLYRRIISTLSNLKNIGRVSDVNDILQSHAERDENALETTYTLVNGFLWAIPVLGFIGTVLGLSVAIGGFGAVLSSTTELDTISQSLQQVTAGLATAFETTLLALVIALFLYLMATALRKAEEEFLDSCAEYCNSHIVEHLRVSPFEPDEE